MTPVVFAFPGNEGVARSLAGVLDAELGAGALRHFPDGDSYIRIDTPIKDRDIIIVCTLDRADAKFLPLCLLTATMRDLGAARIGFISPYLAYMRQDKRFLPGEGVSSQYFAKLLSATADWFVTVDPHLHRRHSLAEIFSIPVAAVHAAQQLASWIREHVAEPVLVGPDGESEQWVASVAAAAGAPWIVLEKLRNGDRNVEIISAPHLGAHAGRTPVIVDDIISTGRTMVETIRRLAEVDPRPPICVGVHAIFAGDAYAALQAAGAAKIVTCNTIPHASNAIDIVDPIAETARRLLAQSVDASKQGINGNQAPPRAAQQS